MRVVAATRSYDVCMASEADHFLRCQPVQSSFDLLASELLGNS